MEIQFVDKTLEKLESADEVRGGYGPQVVRGFRKRMRFIRSATDERDFRAMRSLKFEKLKGDRSHQYSMRINKQWRLILEIKKAESQNVIVVVAIEDYH